METGVSSNSQINGDNLAINEERKGKEFQMTIRTDRYRLAQIKL